MYKYGPLTLSQRPWYPLAAPTSPTFIAEEAPFSKVPCQGFISTTLTSAMLLFNAMGCADVIAACIVAYMRASFVGEMYVCTFAVVMVAVDFAPDSRVHPGP